MSRVFGLWVCLFTAGKLSYLVLLQWERLHCRAVFVNYANLHGIAGVNISLCCNNKELFHNIHNFFCREGLLLIKSVLVSDLY